MNELSDMEMAALQAFIHEDSILRRALGKFVLSRRDVFRELCVVHMLSVPRQFELASDYASKAQFCDEFWGLITDEVEKVSAEPTG